MTSGDRESAVEMTESNKRLIKHCMRNDVTEECACALAEHNRWVHWAQSTKERN